MILGHGRWLFLMSLAAGLCLQFMPLPWSLGTGRPLFVAMVLGYWALFGPNVAVISAALLLGLACDTLYDTPLGQHVLGFTLLVYLLTRLRPTLGLYPIGQLTVALLPFWTAFTLLMFLFDGMARHPSQPLPRFLPLVSTVLLWPFVMLFLDARRSRRKPR